MLGKKSKLTFTDYIFNISYLVVFLVLVTALISSLGFLLKIDITPLHFIISLLVSFGLFYYININKYDKRTFIIIYAAEILLILISMIICNLFFDISYDGLWYHLRCIISLKNGWNPIYESINSGNWGDIFMDGYPCKASWIFGSTIYSLTNNLRMANVLNILLCFATFGFANKFFNNLIRGKYKKKLSIILSSIIAINPIFLEQVFTNYLDLTLGFLVIIYFFVFAGYYFKFWSDESNLFRLIVICLIAIMMNMKLTGLFFAGIYFILFYLLCFKRIFNKTWFSNIKRVFITGLLGIAIGLVIGINPYITNVIRGHNPFFPIVGAGRIDVMGDNVPNTYRNKTNLEKLTYNSLSNTANNISPWAYNIKNPLIISKSELNSIQHDTRVNSIGPLFPLIAYISLICSLTIFIKFLKNRLNNDQKKISALILLIGFVALIFGESWWGRYYPILWMVPELISIILIMNKNMFSKMLGLIILFLMTVNIALVGFSSVSREINFSLPLIKYTNTLKDKTIKYTVTDYNFKFTYDEYFKSEGIKAKYIADKKSITWDFEGINLKIYK